MDTLSVTPQVRPRKGSLRRRKVSFIEMPECPADSWGRQLGQRKEPLPDDWVKLHEMLGDSRHNLPAVAEPHAEPEWKYLRPANVQANLLLCGTDAANLSEDDRRKVWVRSPTDGYIEASLLEDGEKQSTVLTRKGEMTVANKDMQEANPSSFDCCEDMASLTYLNEASVLHNLRQRYKQNLIHTYSGLFCITINPWRWLPIYTPKIVLMYKGQALNSMPPHIYAVSDNVYNNMLEGKTENTKKIVQYFTVIAANKYKAGTITLEEQIIESNPVLEAFGNAKTCHNDNSSRFGKFVRIYFAPTGKVAGAETDSYLLEKSRVVSQSMNERGYHIFYQLLSTGTSAEMKAELRLRGGAADYRYLWQGMAEIEGVDDSREMGHTECGLQILGVVDEERMQLYRMCAGVLQMGQLRFRAKSRHDDQAAIECLDEPADLCYNLGLNMQEFLSALTQPTVKVMNENVKQGRNVQQVQFALGALSKAIYEKQFRWLVKRTNIQLTSQARRTSICQFIGILDIAGFEIFNINSFEQLCINYTNERLQQFFNHQFFIREQDEYKAEGLPWDYVDFAMDLKPQIDLIEMPLGILSMLEEECMVPKGSDVAFAEKLEQRHYGQSSVFGKPKYGRNAPKDISHFSIVHYAGIVNYNVDGWLDKNKDPLNSNVIELFQKADNPLLNSIWNYYGTTGFREGKAKSKQEAKKGPEVRRGSITRSLNFQTVSTVYKEQLMNLLAILNSTKAHFVRCIIPNGDRNPGKLEAPLVLTQLLCNGVLEGIRICRQGYPNRLFYEDFRNRYRILATKEADFDEAPKPATVTICVQMGLHPDKDYQLGYTKIFCRVGVIGRLELMRTDMLRDVVTNMQAQIRWYLIQWRRHREELLIQPTLIIQENIRYWLELRKWSWFKLMLSLRPSARNSADALRDTVLRLENENIDLQSKLADALKSQALAQKEAEGRSQEKFSKLQRELEEQQDSQRQLQSRNEQLTDELTDLKERQNAMLLEKEESDQKLAELQRLLEELTKKQRQLEEASGQRQDAGSETDSSVTGVLGMAAVSDSVAETFYHLVQQTAAQPVRSALTAQFMQALSTAKDGKTFEDELKEWGVNSVDELREMLKRQQDEIRKLTEKCVESNSVQQQAEKTLDQLAEFFVQLGMKLKDVDRLLSDSSDGAQMADTCGTEMRSGASDLGSIISSIDDAQRGNHAILGAKNMDQINSLFGQAQSLGQKAQAKVDEAKMLAEKVEQKDSLIAKFEALLKAMNVALPTSDDEFAELTIATDPIDLADLHEHLNMLEQVLRGEDDDGVVSFSAVAAQQPIGLSIGVAPNTRELDSFEMVPVSEELVPLVGDSHSTSSQQVAAQRGFVATIKGRPKSAAHSATNSTQGANGQSTDANGQSTDNFTVEGLKQQTMKLLGIAKEKQDEKKRLQSQILDQEQRMSEMQQKLNEQQALLDASMTGHSEQHKQMREELDQQEEKMRKLERSLMEKDQILNEYGSKVMHQEQLLCSTQEKDNRISMLEEKLKSQEMLLSSSQGNHIEEQIKSNQLANTLRQQISDLKTQMAAEQAQLVDTKRETSQREQLLSSESLDQQSKLAELQARFDQQRQEMADSDRKLHELQEVQQRQVVDRDKAIVDLKRLLSAKQELLDTSESQLKAVMNEQRRGRLEQQDWSFNLTALKDKMGRLDNVLSTEITELGVSERTGRGRIGRKSRSSSRSSIDGYHKHHRSHSRLSPDEADDKQAKIDYLLAHAEELHSKAVTRQSEAVAIRREADRLGDTVKSMEQEMSHKDERIRELEEMLRKLRKELQEEEATNARTKREMDEFQKLCNKLQRDLECQEEESKRKDQEVAQLQRRLHQTTRLESEQLEMTRKHSATIRELQDQIERTRKDTNNKADDMRQLEVKLSASKEEQNKLMAMIRELQERIDILEKDLQAERAEKKRTEKLLANLEQDYSDLLAKLRAIEKKLEVQLSLVREKEAEVARLEAKIKRMTDDHASELHDLRERHAVSLSEMHDRVEQYHKIALKLECENQSVKAAVFAEGADFEQRRMSRSMSRSQVVAAAPLARSSVAGADALGESERRADECRAADAARQLEDVERQRAELQNEKRLMRREIETFTRALQEESGNNDVLERKLRTAHVGLGRMHKRLSSEQDDKAEMARQMRSLQSEMVQREMKSAERSVDVDMRLDERMRPVGRGAAATASVGYTLRRTCSDMNRPTSSGSASIQHPIEESVFDDEDDDTARSADQHESVDDPQP